MLGHENELGQGESAVPRIEGVSWWRTYLFVDISHQEEIHPILRMSSGEKVHPLVFHEDRKSCSRYKINLTIAAGRDFLEKGNWQFADGASGIEYRVTDTVLEKIESIGRSFYFTGATRLYSVRFYVPSTDKEEPLLRFSIAWFRREKNPRQAFTLLNIEKACLGWYFSIVSRLSKHDGKHILFMSENNTCLAGNMKAIDDRMKERGIDQEFVVSYSFRNIFSPDGKHHGKQGRLRKAMKAGERVSEWISKLNLLAKQDVIFVEDYVPIFSTLSLRPDVKLVQVWHAGFGFKLVGFGRFGIDGSPNPFNSCHRRYTHALVGNENLREIYSEVFGIEQEALLATGMPRLDHFLDSDTRREAMSATYDAYPILDGKKVIMFAPTYRGQNQKSAHYDFARVDFDKLYEYCSKEDAYVLFKMHRFVAEAVPIPQGYEDRFLDVSKHDINQLFYVTDVLITDYSSCFYDYLLLDRPVIFYAYDRSYYMATRGVHRRLEDVAPGPICDTFDEVIEEIANALSGVRRAGKAQDMLIDRCATGEFLASDAVIDHLILGKEVSEICLL